VGEERRLSVELLRRATSPVKKALLKTGYRCNNNCVFCHSAPHRPLEAKSEEIEDKIERARRLGAGMIVFSGGEPTLRPDILRLARFAARRDLALGLISNGRMLCYPALVEKLRDAGLGYVQITLCGPEEHLHDRHVRAPAFVQSRRALELLHYWVGELVINVVVTAWNLEQLEKMRLLAQAFPRARLKFSLVEPEGNALENFSSLVPSLREAARAVALQLGRGGGRVFFDGLPLCLVPQKFWEAESTLREEGFWLMSEAFESDWYPVDEKHRGHAPVCAGCSIRRRCRGVFRTYLERRGWRDLRPLDQPVPNSYVLIASGEKHPAGQGCPWQRLKSSPPLAPREILLKKGRKVEKFAYGGRDFSDAALDYAQRQLGQLYLRIGQTDDFSRAARPLVRSPLCRRCPHWRLCGGLWHPTRSGFSAFDRWLGRRLEALGGRVLDVGCGRAPYIKYLLPAVRAGRLFYHGIDPRRLPRRAAGLRLEKISFAEFNSRTLFDCLLFIRSINHTGRISDTLCRAGELCRPAGRLILVEDVVYGLVETGPGVERGRAGFEHRLNLQLDEAMALCRQAGFKPLSWQAPRPATVPCWYLECER
jgi:MoaA/NifB/PqqE/SkfB family radical SAM enzyme/SAM-dependent methyltransferase